MLDTKQSVDKHVKTSISKLSEQEVSEKCLRWKSAMAALRPAGKFNLISLIFTYFYFQLDSFKNFSKLAIILIIIPKNVVKIYSKFSEISEIQQPMTLALRFFNFLVYYFLTEYYFWMPFFIHFKCELLWKKEFK